MPTSQDRPCNCTARPADKATWPCPAQSITGDDLKALLGAPVRVTTRLGSEIPGTWTGILAIGKLSWYVAAPIGTDPSTFIYREDWHTLEPIGNNTVGALAATLPNPAGPRVADFRRIRVQLGGTYGRGDGDWYDVESIHAPHGADSVTVRIPETVAERYRQEGRRAMLAEFRDLLNVARA